MPHDVQTVRFCRILGPLMILFAVAVELRLEEMSAIGASFFASAALVWIMGALLAFAGMLIIAFHQIWSRAASIAVSLFGWFLLLRGVTLLVIPQAYSEATTGAFQSPLLVRCGFAVLGLIGVWLAGVGWRHAFEAPTLSLVGKVH